MEKGIIEEDEQLLKILKMVMRTGKCSLVDSLCSDGGDHESSLFYCITYSENVSLVIQEYLAPGIWKIFGLYSSLPFDDNHWRLGRQHVYQ